MKRVLVLLLLLSSPALIIAQPDQEHKRQGAYLRFAPAELNMGSIPLDRVTDETGRLSFTLHNDGVKPLIVSNASACCGTRVNEWPRQPIAPGDSAVVRIEFRVNPRPHRINRSVTVQSNALNGQVQRIALVGEVVAPASPANQIELP